MEEHCLHFFDKLNLFSTFNWRSKCKFALLNYKLDIHQPENYPSIYLKSKK